MAVFAAALAMVDVRIVLALMALQTCAGVWYSASFVPCTYNWTHGRPVCSLVLRDVERRAD